MSSTTAPPGLAEPKLPLARYQFHFQGDPARLPPYPGSAWRGALGWALRRAVCVTRQARCADCLLYRQCVYPYAFETPPPPDSAKMRRYTAAPHPFALRVEANQAGPDYRLGVVLMGRAERLLPYFIHALTEAGKAGLGGSRTPFALEGVSQATADGEWRPVYAPGEPLRSFPPCVPPLPPPPERVVVELETPLRLKRDQHLVTPARFDFADLFRSLLRRISMLTYFHTDTPLETDFAALSRAARAVPIEEVAVAWYDWTRFSSRQDTELKMDGLMGRFAVAGAHLAPFWPYLWLGQWTHAGKGATLGLGRYRIVPSAATSLSSGAEGEAGLVGMDEDWSNGAAGSIYG